MYNRLAVTAADGGEPLPTNTRVTQDQAGARSLEKARPSLCVRHTYKRGRANKFRSTNAAEISKGRQAPRAERKSITSAFFGRAGKQNERWKIQRFVIPPTPPSHSSPCPPISRAPGTIAPLVSRTDKNCLFGHMPVVDIFARR